MRPARSVMRMVSGLTLQFYLPDWTAVLVRHECSYSALTERERAREPCLGASQLSNTGRQPPSNSLQSTLPVNINTTQSVSQSPVSSPLNFIQYFPFSLTDPPPPFPPPQSWRDSPVAAAAWPWAEQQRRLHCHYREEGRHARHSGRTMRGGGGRGDQRGVKTPSNSLPPPPPSPIGNVSSCINQLW